MAFGGRLMVEPSSAFAPRPTRHEDRAMLFRALEVAENFSLVRIECSALTFALASA